MTTPNHEEFLERSIARHELYALAGKLNWPGIAFVEASGRLISIAPGEAGWRDAALPWASQRRGAWIELARVEHQRTPEKTETEDRS